MRRVVGVDQLSVGGDRVDRRQAIAGRAVHAAGERRAAADRVPADPDGGAGAGREVQAVLAERLREGLTAGAGSDRDRPRRRVDLPSIQ